MVSAQVPDTSRADSTLPQLLQPAESGRRTSRVIGPEVTRRRGVGVDVELVKTLDPEGDNQLVFNLFPPATFIGRVEDKAFPLKWIGYPDSFSLSGSIQGIPGSSFQLLYLQGVLAGNIRVPGSGEYQIRPTAPGAYEVWEIDSARFPACVVRQQQQFFPQPVTKVLGTSPSSPLDNGATIDVMIMYTSDARIALGGELNIIIESAFAVLDTNASFANSLINTKLRLVHLAEIPYAESGSANTDLNRLTSPDDGFLDELHTIRDEVGADIVSLFVSSFDACGASWMMTDVSPDFQSSAFNVCAINCVAMNFTFTHEVGHNLGCQHNREDAGGVQGAFPYSYGYWDPVGGFRTVMSLPNGSPLFRQFSNPLVVQQSGIPTGIPEGQPNSADNAKTINNTALTVANFRQSVCCDPVLNFDCNTNNINDAEDISTGTSLDCNANKIPDECDVRRSSSSFASASGELSPIGLGFPVSHTLTSPPEALGDVTLRFAAIADLDSTQVQLDVYLNDVFQGHIFRNNGTLCPVTPDEDELVVAMADFNTLVNGGDAVVRIETRDSAEFDACNGSSWVSLTLRYISAHTSVEPDVNNNGIPDVCELALGDSNLDGVINVTDLLNLLAAWGICGGCAEDTDGDGLINITDLLTLLGNWGLLV